LALLAVAMGDDAPPVALVGVGVVAGLMCTMHPRAIALPIAVGLCATCHLVRHGTPRRRLTGLVAGLVVGTAVGYLLVARYAPDGASGSDDAHYSVRRVVSKLGDLDALRD